VREDRYEVSIGAEFVMSSVGKTGEAAKFVALATGAWKGTRDQEKKIKEAAMGRQVLGGSSKLKVKCLRKVPRHGLHQNTMRAERGCLCYQRSGLSRQNNGLFCYNAQVRYRNAPAGLAFSIPDLQNAYYIQMMGLLKLDYQNPPPPPVGWLEPLLNALEVSLTGKHSYLLPDDFMPNGSNEVDLAL
jgi:hypothetical protein